VQIPGAGHSVGDIVPVRITGVAANSLFGEAAGAAVPAPAAA
jgi:TRAM domain